MMFKRCLPFALVALAIASMCATASAAEDRAGWRVNAHAYPTDLPPGEGGFVKISLFDVGAAPNSGPVTVTDELPAGVTYSGAPPKIEGSTRPEPWECSGMTVVTCISTEPIEGSYEYPIDIEVRVDKSVVVGSYPSRVTASGGGAIEVAATTNQLTLSSTPAPYGLTNIEAWATNANGTNDTQAGSHPYEFTLALNLNTEPSELPVPDTEEADGPAVSETRSFNVELPPGIIGDPNAVPQCTIQQFDSSKCPVQSQIGVDNVLLKEIYLPFSIYNVVPAAGVPALFAFNIVGVKTYLEAKVRSGGDYGITEHVEDIAQRQVVANQAVIWGVPADPSHDVSRCSNGGTICGLASGAPEVPFLTLPTACGAPQEFRVQSEAWSDESLTSEAAFHADGEDGSPVGIEGCAHLAMSPSLTAAPDTSQSDTPAGLTVDVKVPQEGLLGPESIAPADIQNTSVTLPEGVVINPGQAAGLAACQPSEDGLGALPDGREDTGPPSCPLASKVGTVSIASPLLADRLEGNVYVLQSNPPNLQLLVAASGDGVNVKIVLHVHLDESTGRLTTTVEKIPQFPVTDFSLSFSGGAQAALVTPTKCGRYGSNADFTPWSSPFSEDSLVESYFDIGSAPAGGGCGAELPFGPSLIAGSTTDQAGGFTDFSLLLRASDGQQRIEKLQFKVPQGLLGMISQVPLCGEPQAQDGTCSSASQIGHTTVASGPGPYPLVVPQPGQPPAAIYLTGPYKGAPYGLSIVVPVVVGPFTLQTQVVRAKIEVDPVTAQITVTTDPLPQVIDGVPTDLRTVNAVIDRSGFMFNPTNCAPMSFSGTAWGTPPPGVGGTGSTAAISSPFQMGSCRSLLFKPDFKVSTSGKTSRKNGASLDAKIVYPRGPLGANQASSQSNLKSVKVDLPKQLPSRLTTLQKACTSQVFEANPANCPADSRVGSASAVTPVLPVTLTGPAYFVSYGGAKFPELVFALQGYGVTIYVHGETFINKAGITSSTFHQVPDVPIYEFELKLPQGPFSALAANGNLCNTRLKMPTAFTAQDGAVIHQTTPITVTGCAKGKAKQKAKAKHKTKKQ
jgi:hypothetical protein